MRVVLALFLCVIMGSAAFAQQTAALEGGLLASTPKGWVQFCGDEPQECESFKQSNTLIHLNEKALSTLTKTNLEVNKSVKQVSDAANYGFHEFWAYPTNGKGDCEDIVLEKRRRLIAMGYPRSALLITIVRDLKNEGHAVLTVRTDKGDIILDNQEQRLKIWFQTGYKFIKRQSEENQNLWLALNAGETYHTATLGR